MILIGVDPHKSSHTAVAVDAAGHQVAQRRFVVNAGTFGRLMRCAFDAHRVSLDLLSAAASRGGSNSA